MGEAGLLGLRELGLPPWKGLMGLRLPLRRLGLLGGPPTSPSSVITDMSSSRLLRIAPCEALSSAGALHARACHHVCLLSTFVPAMHEVDRDACLQPQLRMVTYCLDGIIQAALQLLPTQCALHAQRLFLAADSRRSGGTMLVQRLLWRQTR